MKSIHLSYTTELQEPKTAIRSHLWFKNHQAANRAIRQMLKINLENGIIKYKDFITTETQIVTTQST